MKGSSTKMTFKKFISDFLRRACVTFSIIMLIYIIIAAIINVGDNELLLEAGRIALFFVFSCLLSCANLIFELKTMGGGLRLLSHYLIILFAFYSCFLLTLGLKTSGLVVGFVMFTAVYFAVMGIRRALISSYRKNVEASEEYQKQFPERRSK